MTSNSQTSGKLEAESDIPMASEVNPAKPIWEPQPSKSTIQDIAVNCVKRLEYIGHTNMEISLANITENLLNVNGSGNYHASTEDTPLPALKTESDTQE